MTTDAITIRDHEKLQQLTADLAAQQDTVASAVTAAEQASAAAKAAAGAATGPDDCAEALAAYRELAEAAAVTLAEAASPAAAGARQLAALTGQLRELQDDVVGEDHGDAETLRGE